jgi:hypothetical protein
MLKRTLLRTVLFVLLSSSALGGVLTVDGKDISYKWKDGDFIWVAPETTNQESDREEYTKCEAQFSADSQWEIRSEHRFFSAPCVLRPKQSEEWVTGYLAAQPHLAELKEQEAEKPPGSGLSPKRLQELLSKEQKPYLSHCPKGFELNVYSEKGKPEAVECTGTATIKCKDGYFDGNLTCSRTTYQPCKEGSVTDAKEKLCMSCNWGGTLDNDKKHTTLSCGGGGGRNYACSTVKYCKVKISNIKGASASSAANPENAGW